jgi:hypothetical protein
MATSSRTPQGILDGSLPHGLKPITTKPNQPSSGVPVLPDSPFQPTSQSHVAALASSLLQRGSSDLALDKAASAPVPPVLQDSPYQPASHEHVAQLAHAYTGHVHKDSDAKPTTPQHTPVLADSSDFEPGSRSHWRSSLARSPAGCRHRSTAAAVVQPRSSSCLGTCLTGQTQSHMFQNL